MKLTDQPDQVSLTDINWIDLQVEALSLISGQNEKPRSLSGGNIFEEGCLFILNQTPDNVGRQRFDLITLRFRFGMSGRQEILKCCV